MDLDSSILRIFVSDLHPSLITLDYDQLMALYNAVESVFYTDEKVLEIVSDEAAAYFSRSLCSSDPRQSQ